MVNTNRLMFVNDYQRLQLFSLGCYPLITQIPNHLRASNLVTC